MKRFKFSLQTLHDLHEQERSDAEHALAQAAAEVAAAAAHIEVLRDTINQALAALTVNLQTKAPNAREAEMHAEYLTTLDKRLATARAHYANCERHRETKLQELIKASAAAEATTKLRQQYYNHYVAELAREEQTLMDELATIATVRRMRGAS